MDKKIIYGASAVAILSVGGFMYLQQDRPVEPKSGEVLKTEKKEGKHGEAQHLKDDDKVNNVKKVNDAPAKKEVKNSELFAKNKSVLDTVITNMSSYLSSAEDNPIKNGYKEDEVTHIPDKYNIDKYFDDSNVALDLANSLNQSTISGKQVHQGDGEAAVSQMPKVGDEYILTHKDFSLDNPDDTSGVLEVTGKVGLQVKGFDTKEYEISFTIEDGIISDASVIDSGE